jgi:hypothetical protein
MTNCVAMRLNAGMVFLSDSRTNAGLDQISTFRKMTVFEKPGERSMVMLAAGNLAITQAVRQLLRHRGHPCRQRLGRDLDLERAAACSMPCASWGPRYARSTNAMPRSRSASRDETNALLPHDQKHLGPAPARGLRKHPGPRSWGPDATEHALSSPVVEQPAALDPSRRSRHRRHDGDHRGSRMPTAALKRPEETRAAA